MTSGTGKRLLYHGALWAAYLVLLIFWFSLPFTLETAIWHALRMLFIHMIIFYVNTRLLLPAFIEKNAWIAYVLTILVSMIVIYFYFTFTNQFLPFERLEGTVARPPRPGRGFRGSRLIIQNLFLSLGVYFASTINYIMQQARKRREDAIQNEKEQLETEMKLLRSQINPHFMFNALNNIYALSVQKNEKTPEAVMKLSQMMRYVLYESNVDTVHVNREWEYIENYIDIQLLKFENEVNVGRNSEIDEDMMIAPMLLLPFVENAFKHSNIEVDERARIDILLKVKNGRLQFAVENTLPNTEVSKDSVGGIGLENVRRRLAYIYQNQHELEITESAGNFKVTLNITLR